MELSWISRIKITIVVALGVLVYAVAFWNWFEPADPYGAVVFSFGFSKLAVLMAVGFGLGLVSYFIGWPFGRQIGVLAVPAGICAIGIRSGSVFNMVLHTSGEAGRVAIYRTLWWDGAIWVLLAAAGYLGVLAGEKIKRSEVVALDGGPKKDSVINAIIAFVISVVIGGLLVSMFVRDVSYADERVKAVVGQAANLQVNLGVMFALGLTAFAIKYGLNASWVWSGLATAVIPAIAMNVKGQKTAGYMTANWPAAFNSNSILCVLPVQMTGWGILGAVIGYWLAVRFKHWQQEQAGK